MSNTSIINIAYSFVLFFLLAKRTALAGGGCRDPIISESTDDGTHHNHADLLGVPADRIDKITNIKVYTGGYTIFNLGPVVRRMEVTYRLKNGDTTTINLGSGGTAQPEIVLEENEYVSRVETLTGEYVDYVRICKTDGVDERCFGPFGGKGHLPPGRVFEKDRSVVKAVSHVN